jgi:uncharacterized protein YggE
MLIVLSSDAVRAAPRLAPAVDAALITAVGTGIVPGELDPSTLPQTVNANLQSQNADPHKALDDVRAKVDALRTAAMKAGVPAGAVHLAGLNLMPVINVKPGAPASQPPGAPSELSGYTANANVQIETVGPQQLATVLAVAAANGVNVNAGFGKGVPSQAAPDASAIGPAVRDAVAQARAYAEAAARASGKTLGAVHALSIAPPTPDCCPPVNGWRVQVTVSYEIAP